VPIDLISKLPTFSDFTLIFIWTVPDTESAPIAEVGLEIIPVLGADGVLYLDYLTWDGIPKVIFSRPARRGKMWRKAWITGLDHFGTWAEVPFRISQDEGRGLLIQGSREWTDYRVGADVTPQLIKSGGIAARVQGLRRFYALMLSERGKVRLIKGLDGDRILAEANFPWQIGKTYHLDLSVIGDRLQGEVDGRLLFDIHDIERPLLSGCVALACEEGCFSTNSIYVAPIG